MIKDRKTKICVMKCKYCLSIYRAANHRVKYCSLECSLHDGYKVDTKTNCWLWGRLMGKKNKTGTPLLFYLQKYYNPKKLILSIYKPQEMVRNEVKATCENKCCVNPDHLYYTYARNNRSQRRVWFDDTELAIKIIKDDRIYSDIGREHNIPYEQIKRIKDGKIRIDLKDLPRPERKRRPKLSYKDIIEIRATTRSITTTTLSKKYGVSRPTIMAVRKGRTWKEID